MPASLPTFSLSLFEADPSFADCVPEADRPLARRVGTVPSLDLPAGPWTPPGGHGDGDLPFAWVVVRGALVASTRLGGREATRLIGPGDVFDPNRTGSRLLAVEHAWRVLAPATLAALDGRFLAMSRRWPLLTLALQQRLCDEAVRAATLAAIGHLPRVEQRLVGLFWHLADRFGQEGEDAVEIDLDLTHAALGRLVGARRPTVTIALQALRETGQLTRAPHGAWLLADRSRDLLGA